MQRHGSVELALQPLQPGQYGAGRAWSHGASHDRVDSNSAFQAVIFKRLIQHIIDIDRRNTQEFVHRFAAQPKANIPAEFRQRGFVGECHVLKSRRLVIEQGAQRFGVGQVLFPEYWIGFFVRLWQTLARHTVSANCQVLAIGIQCDSVNCLTRRVAELVEFEVTTYCRAYGVGRMCEPGKVIVIPNCARCRHTAGRIRGLEAQDLQSGASEIRRAHKTIVTGTDNDCVCTFSHR